MTHTAPRLRVLRSERPTSQEKYQTMPMSCQWGLACRSLPDCYFGLSWQVGSHPRIGNTSPQASGATVEPSDLGGMGAHPQSCGCSAGFYAQQSFSPACIRAAPGRRETLASVRRTSAQLSKRSSRGMWRRRRPNGCFRETGQDERLLWSRGPEWQLLAGLGQNSRAITHTSKRSSPAEGTASGQTASAQAGNLTGIRNKGFILVAIRS